MAGRVTARTRNYDKRERASKPGIFNPKAAGRLNKNIHLQSVDISKFLDDGFIPVVAGQIRF
jgi:hypothetical protein